MTTDIQQARDALAKWRTDATGAPWSLGDQAPWDHLALNVAGEDGDADVTDYIAGWDARLIVGTAGNPELLDALDALLYSYQRINERNRPGHLNAIAAAIITADERMSA